MSDLQPPDETGVQGLSSTERMMAEIQDWQKRSREDQIHLDQRHYGIEFTRQNSEFLSLQSDLERLLGSGDIGEFVPLAPEDQYITPELGVSRKLYFSHPKYPEHVFCVTGIGKVTLAEGKKLQVTAPDTSQTVADVADAKQLPVYINAVYGVDARGNDISHRGDDPLGAYWLKSAEDKYDQTVEAVRLLEKSEHAESCTPVSAGRYGGIGEAGSQPVGFFVYAMPADVMGLPRVLQRSFEDVKKAAASGNMIDATKAAMNSKYTIAIFNAAAGIRHLQDFDRVHREAHPGNVFVRPDGRVIWTDWTTLQHVGRHKTRYDKRLGMSPLDKAKWEDVKLFLTQTALPKHTGALESIITQVTLTAGCLGYQQPRQDQMRSMQVGLVKEYLEINKLLKLPESGVAPEDLTRSTVAVMLDRWKMVMFPSAK